MIRTIARLLPVFLLPGLATGQQPLPVNATTEARIVPQEEFVEYLFEATEAGILTIAVRMPENPGTNDVALFFIDESIARETTTLSDMMMSAYTEERMLMADEDFRGDATAEQLAAPVPHAGRFIVRVAAMEPGTFRMMTGFMAFPDVAGAAIEMPDPVTLTLGETRMGDIEPNRPLVYQFRSPRDGLLTTLSRGSGDVTLSVWAVPDGEERMRRIAESDADQDGSTASESIAVKVSRGQLVQIRLSAYERSRCAVFAQVVDHDDLLDTLATEAAKGPPHALIGQRLPELTLVNLRGETEVLSDVDARIVVLDVWATWCPPCAVSMPDIQRLHEWVEEAGVPVAVRAINTGEDAMQVRAFLREKRLTLPVLLDPDGSAGRALQTDAIPMTVIALDGRIEAAFSGVQPDHGRHIHSIVKDLLAKIDAPPQ